MPRADAPRPLRALLHPVRGWLALAVVVQVVSSALVLAPLIGVGELTRILLSVPVDADRAWSVVLASTGLLAVGFALRGAADLITHLADNGLALHVRRALAARLAAAPLGWFGEQTSGRIKQGMQDDVSGLHHFVAHSFTDLAAAVTTPVVVYAYLFLLDWRLALVLLVPVLIFVLIYRGMMAGSTPKMARYGQVLGELNSAVVEFVTGIPVVKTFGQAGRAHRAYHEAVNRFTGFFLPWARPLIRPETISSAVLSPVTMILLALGGGTALVAVGAMNPVDVVPFVVLGIGLCAPITNLASGAQALQLATGSAARVGAMLDIPRDAEPDRPRRPRGTTVEFDRVRFSYDGTHEVLEEVSARIEPGTITAIVGESGSGKSTLARLLLRFHRPTGGAVRIGGVDVRDIASEELYRIVGSVFQDVTLLRVSIAENIGLGRPGASRDEIESAARAAAIHDRIMALPRGYDSVPGEDAALSGGEAQRVGVARAILLDPPVLVLDEPTSAADVESERAVQDALSTLVGSDPRRSIVVIAHRLETITGVDTILVLSDGRVVERGDHEQLLAAGGRYAALWNAQHTSALEPR